LKLDEIRAAEAKLLLPTYERNPVLFTGGKGAHLIDENGERYGAYLNGWAFSGAAYFTQYDNLVDSFTTGGIQSKINTGRAKTVGLEANAATTVSVWMMSLGYNYMDARNEQLDEPLRLSPKHQVSASAATTRTYRRRTQRNILDP